MVSKPATSSIVRLCSSSASVSLAVVRIADREQVAEQVVARVGAALGGQLGEVVEQLGRSRR